MRKGVPIPVCGIIPETEEEKRLFESAQERKKRRLKIRDFTTKSNE